MRVERDFTLDLRAPGRTILRTASFLCRSMFRPRLVALRIAGRLVGDRVVEEKGRVWLWRLWDR